MSDLITAMPADKYHATDAISVSGLKEILRSPAHYKHKYLDGNQKQSAALEFGRAMHALVLEPERLNEEVAVAPDKSGYPNALDSMDEMKQWLKERDLPVSAKTKGELIQRIREADANAVFWGDVLEDFHRNSAGKSVISAEEMAKANKMADAILNNAAARLVLEGMGHAEVSAFWSQGEGKHEIPCRARFDWMREDGLIVDIKTTIDASPAGFAKQAYNFGYHMQAWWYMRAYEACTGKKAEGFVFIAIEKDDPHCVGVYAASAEMMKLGQMDCETALGIYRNSRQTDDWHGYAEQIEILNLPKWAENRLNFGA